MTDQNAAAPAETAAPAEDSTWSASVRAFEREASGWLTPADAPQLMALRAIAAELDGGSFQAALISQFTLVHRGLLARRPGGKPDPAGGGETEPTMFELFGGVWQGDS